MSEENKDSMLNLINELFEKMKQRRYDDDEYKEIVFYTGAENYNEMKVFVDKIMGRVDYKPKITEYKPQRSSARKR